MNFEDERLMSMCLDGLAEACDALEYIEYTDSDISQWIDQINALYEEIRVRLGG